MKDNIHFGTDGWRGIINEDVSEKSMALVAQAFADSLCAAKKDSYKTAVGFDGRKNSRLYAEIFSEVLSGNGIYVFLSDRIIPTPVLSYCVKNNHLDAGVMITASHNPPEYNGVKFKASYGGPYLSENTSNVEKYLLNSEIRRNRDRIIITDLLSQYLEQISRIIDFSKIRSSRINVLVDSMGGAGQNIIQNILANNEILAETIFSTPDENFSGRQAEPIENNLQPLSARLKSGSFSMGLATDGDADRLGVMLESGGWLNAQETILLFADYLCRNKKLEGDIIKTSSVTDKLRSFENNDRRVIDVQVGFKYICEEMIRRDVLFGCEESGGFGYGFHMPERDGILSGLLLCEILASSGFHGISQLVESIREIYGKVFYSRQDLQYESTSRNSILPNLFLNPPQRIGNHKIITMQKFLSSRTVISGLKFVLEGDSRWLLIRSSETEPLIRIYAEGESKAEVQNILEYGESIIFRK